jgi:sphingolipid delta-4 desaturase
LFPDFVGGTITASLVLSIHEITHYLAFKAFLPNKILACIANLPIVIPFCVEFKVRLDLKESE